MAGKRIKRRLLIEKQTYKVMKWTSVKKRLPAEGSYLCFMANGYIKMCYFDGTEWLDMWKSILEGVVRNWMPLPESPND